MEGEKHKMDIWNTITHIAHEDLVAWTFWLALAILILLAYLALILTLAVRNQD